MSGPGRPAPGRTAASAGPTLFVRYAFPPNRLGYCGPDDAGGFFSAGVAGAVDGGLRARCRQFTGAWPYLELLAGATGIGDPLDRRVVEAYWVGNRLLGQVGAGGLGRSMEDRFRRMTGRQFPGLADSVAAGGLPHHSYHVFCVYPWTGFLSDGSRSAHALTVLDRCRIRWGRVVAVTGDQVVVEAAPLTWDGRRLGLGPPAVETVLRAVDGTGFLPDLAAGEWVALHWDWVCDRLAAGQLAALRRYTLLHLGIVNAGRSGAGSALDR